MPMAIRDPQYGGYRVFVGDLGPRVLKQDLEKAFEQFGRLLDCWVARNPPGHAFLLFKYPREAERAVERMEGSMVSGRRIRVEHARPHEDRMKEVSRRGGAAHHSHPMTGELPHRYGTRPKETSHKGPRYRGGKDWPQSHSRQWPPHPRKSPPSRHHSDHSDHYRRRRSWSHEHDRYKRRRSEEARGRSPRDWPPRERSPRDRSPRDWPPRDRSPRDWPPRDRSRDQSARDRSPRDRSPRYRSPKDRSPSDRHYYEDREGTGSRGSHRLMSVAAPFPKKVVMKTDQGNQTDTEILAAMSTQVQDSCSRAAGGEQTTPDSKDKPAIEISSPVNGTVTADVKCAPEDNVIDKADDKLADGSSKADDNVTTKESSGRKDVASGISNNQAKPEISNSSCGPEESSDHCETDREKSKGNLELNRPCISLHLTPTKRSRSSSAHAHTSPSYISSTKHRRSSSTQVQTSPTSASGSRHRESISTQVQTSPSSASGATSGRRNWSGSDSESDMSDNEVSVTGGDVNGNEEVDVNWEMVQRKSERVKKESEKMEKRDNDEVEKKDSDEVEKKDRDKVEKKDSDEVEKKDRDKVEKKDSDEVEKKDSDEVEKKDSDEVEKKYSDEVEKKDSEKAVKNNNVEIAKVESEEMVKKDSEEMVKKHNEEVVKKDTESSEQMDTLDIPLPAIALS